MLKRQRILFAAVALAALAVSTARADERLDKRRDDVVIAVEKTADAVVNISTEKLVQGSLFGDMAPFADPFGMFTRPEIAISLGSGGLFTPDGYIFTNAHVVNRASKIVVTLHDGSQHPAKLINVDLNTDVAVVKIDVDKPLPCLTLGRSDDLMVGEEAIAVGNPFGLSNTVTQGVISATHRDVVVEDRVLFKDFLQTDALINPGNSGGPLLNIFGEVIGVNSAMRANAQGIGFAIPIDRVRRSLGSLMDYRKLRRIRLGFDLDEKYIGTGPASQIVVKAVERGGPAAKAGVDVSDVVTEVAGRKVSTLVDFMAAVLSLANERFDMTVTRDGAERVISVTPMAIPKPDGVKLAMAVLGISVQQMDRSKAQDVGIDIDKGILVSSVSSSSPAGRAGIAEGDVILQVNDTLTPDLDSLGTALEGVQVTGSVYLVGLTVQGNMVSRFQVEVPLRQPERS